MTQKKPYNIRAQALCVIEVTAKLGFEQRGQGDLFGVKQSGDMTFKIANLKRDYKILLQAKKDSENYLANALFKGNSLYENLIEKINFLD